MPERVPGEPPSRWTIINDYSKTVVTVCSALLALMAAFSDKLRDIQSWPSLQSAAWTTAIFGLGLSALCALWVPARMERYLRVLAKGAPDPNNPDTATQIEWNLRSHYIWWCKCAANLSYFLLAFALVALVFFGVMGPVQAKDEKTALTAAFSLLEKVTGVSQPRLIIESFDFVPTADAFEIVVLEQTSNTRFKVTVPRGATPLSFHKVP